MVDGFPILISAFFTHFPYFWRYFGAPVENALRDVQRGAFSTGGHFWGVLSSGGTSRAHRMRK